MNGRSVFLIGPEGLVLTADIVFNDGVCRVQYILRRTVILLQLDHTGFRIYFFKIQYITDIGAPKLVNGLVVVAYHAQIPVPGRQQTDEFKLRRIGILVFIHHNIPEAVLVAFQHFRHCLK